MLTMLAVAIEVSDNGVKIGYAPFVIAIVPLLLVLLTLALIIFYFYFKRRLEHKQIMAAIEKGTPLSELRPPKPTGLAWIKNLTAGIALLIITAGLICVTLVCRGDFDELEDMFGYFVVAVILFALGISRLIRGLLQRKNQPSNKNSTAENTQPGVSVEKAT